jgi:hypothetical protein
MASDELTTVRDAYQKTTPARWMGARNLWAADTAGQTLWEYRAVPRQMQQYLASDFAQADVAFMALAHELMPTLLDRLDHAEEQLAESERQQQQLTQAREENERLKASMHQLAGRALEAEVLLREYTDLLSLRALPLTEELLVLHRKYRAFLAEHLH